MTFKDCFVVIWVFIGAFGGLFIYIPISLVSSWVIPKEIEEKYSNRNFGTNGLGRLYGIFIKTGSAGPMFAKSVAFPNWYGKDCELENLRNECSQPYKAFAIIYGTFALVFEYFFIAGFAISMIYVTWFK